MHVTVKPYFIKQVCQQKPCWPFKSCC